MPDLARNFEGSISGGRCWGPHDGHTIIHAANLADTMEEGHRYKTHCRWGLVELLGLTCPSRLVGEAIGKAASCEICPKLEVDRGTQPRCVSISEKLGCCSYLTLGMERR